MFLFFTIINLEKLLKLKNYFEFGPIDTILMNDIYFLIYDNVQMKDIAQN